MGADNYSKKLKEQEVQLRIDFNKAMSRIRKEASIKDCFHPLKKECVLPIKSAHSLQRQGALKLLEATDSSGNSYLYVHAEREHNFQADFFDLKPVGRKSATTFNGFCSYHDTEVFKEIENDPENTDLKNDFHCFLHSYRSFAIAYHKKHEENKLYNSSDPEIIRMLNNWYPSGQINEVKEGVKAALLDLKLPKLKFDQLLIEKKYSDLEYLIYEVPYTIPIGCASCITPHSTPSGRIIQMDPYSPFQSFIFTTVLPFKNRSIVILSAFPDDQLACDLLDEIEKIKYPLQKEKYLSFFVFTGAENVVLSPKLIDKKSLSWRKEYCELLNHIANPKTSLLRFNRKKYFINYFEESNAI